MLITAFIIASFLILAWYWPYVCDFIQTHVVSAIRKSLGDICADRLLKLLVFVDKGMCLTKRVLVSAFRLFRSVLIRMTTTFFKKTPTTVVKTTETIHRKDEKTGTRTVEREEVNWEDVPSDVRREFVVNGQDEVEVDDREIFAHKCRESAKKQDMGEDVLMELTLTV